MPSKTPISTKLTGNNLHLPYDVDRLAAVERDRQAGLLPGVEAAIENVGLAVCDAAESRAALPVVRAPERQ